jgi:hypothetical protein
MAFSLTDEEVAQSEHLGSHLDDAGTALVAAVESFNEAMVTAWNEVDEAQEAYNYAVGNAQSFMEDVVEEHQKEFEAKPEIWQKGPAGKAARAWLEEWSMTLDECDLEMPEALIVPTVVVADDLTGLSDGPEAT